MNIVNSSVTPMMAQFLEIKKEYPDALLFYRMGDFYEMFFDDAVAASQALDIALTKRGKHLGNDIPMCGVPFHAAEGYMLTLIRKGFRVAVCEQLENPAEAKKRGAKSVVKRGVVRLVTPGTLTEDSLLDARQHNFLASFTEVRGEGAFAWVDVSTGEFQVTPCTVKDLSPMLARIAPREVLLGESETENLHDIIEDAGSSVTFLARSAFDSASAQARLCLIFSVKTLDAFGSFSRAELAAMGAIVDYLEVTQKGKLPLLHPPTQEIKGGAMHIDAATRRNLELTQSLSGDRAGSLLAAIDRTVTGAGARLLKTRLTSPLTDTDEIRQRHESIAHFCEYPSLGETCRQAFRRVPDIDRSLSRLSLDRGGPRDMAAIRDGLNQAQEISGFFQDDNPPEILLSATHNMIGHKQTIELLDTALVAEPPLLTRDGGFVASGYSKELDEARRLRDEGRGVIAGMQAEYSKVTGINALKVKHNNVLGYFIETPAGHASKMLNPPLSESFIHRQTTANAVRFTTVELSELETKILNAGSRAQEIEKTIFETLRQTLLKVAPSIAQTARALAEVDLHSSLADLAMGENWTRPTILKNREFKIVGGRHPVVEQALRAADDNPFVANDCDLSPKGVLSKPLWLLTGPNMAGKSTFLRQNALIALLAQMGSFVPASSAEIGVVTQLFSRVGASDDLARGRSTFMVEMVETAAILNQAGESALVILDEIGRGTATYDGLSIAWATLEHLHDANKCRTLFATHYHELTSLSSKLSGLMNATVSVKEWDGDVVFLHEVKAGAADRSYGVQVAKLAGLPFAVIERARIVLEALEKGEQSGGARTQKLVEDLPLFSISSQPAVLQKQDSAVENRLSEVLPDELTPKQALSLIYELKELL